MFNNSLFMKGKILSSVVGIVIFCTGHFGQRIHEGSKFIRFRGANLDELTAEVWERAVTKFVRYYVLVLVNWSQ